MILLWLLADIAKLTEAERASLIGAAGVVVAAALGAVATVRKIGQQTSDTRAVRASLGESNGQGSVVTMLEDVKKGMDALRKTMGSHSERQDIIDRRVYNLEQAFIRNNDAIHRKLDVIKASTVTGMETEQDIHDRAAAAHPEDP